MKIENLVILKKYVKILKITHLGQYSLVLMQLQTYQKVFEIAVT